ncbi:MAG: ATP-binding cassette domain-containing protein [Candidatus Bathyarchaeia archaeon]
MPILITNNLSRQFGDFKAVDNLNIQVNEGEIFGLLGPNGAGKTTSIKMIITLLPPTSGSISIGGYDVKHNASQVRRLIGYVPQVLSADGTLTGFENLLVFSKLYDLPRQGRKNRILDALEFMGLGSVADKMVKNYSGGMVRRLEIAQSMMHNPKMLFLDEPTIGLDPVGRKAVWDHIEKLRDDFGTTIFVTTHYMEEADQLCSRLAIMNHGKIVASGTPDSLKASMNKEDATLDDVFSFYAGDILESGGDFKEASRVRRTARRLA